MKPKTLISVEDKKLLTRDGQLTGLPINRDILLVNNRYRAIFTNNNNRERQ